MKRLALFAAAIALMAGGAASTTAYAGNGHGNPTPGCQTSSWHVVLSPFTDSTYDMNPLVRCHPTAGSKGTWTLSGSGQLEGGCAMTISGTLHGSVFTAEWDFTDGCAGQVVNLTGTLVWGDNDNPTTGSGSGDWTSNCCGGGTWTATRLS
jgi:hypothetical protein